MNLKKYLYTSVTILAAAFLFVSCGEKDGANKDTAAAESDAKPYPLDVCIVSGEKLGSMGKAHVFVHEGQEIKMCCDKCVPDFNKDPNSFLAKLKE